MNPPLWRWLVRHRIAVANIGLVVVLVIGLGYLAGWVMRVDPFRSTFTVRVEMAASGGLQPNNDVAFRGWRVGRVRSIDITRDGVVAVAEIDSTAQIPASGTAAVQRLSAAGEQFLDLLPDTDDGPYLGDGSVIDAGKVTLPVPVQSVLSDVTGMINGLNPDRLEVIVDELDKALSGGPDQLREVVSGMSQALTGLDSLLPQTTKLIENLEVIAGTTAHAQPDLSTLTRDSAVLFNQTAAADQELRRLLDLGPGQLATLGDVVAETSDPATDLVANMVAITRAAQLRTPAMAALFPSMRQFTKAIGVPAHDGEFHTLADFLPRPTCDYRTIPIAPELVADTRVRLYNYCLAEDSPSQIRGSADAPRPDVPNNTAGPPPGVTGNELSQPNQPAIPAN